MIFQKPGQWLILLLSTHSHAQFMPALWNFHAPGNAGCISEMFYPLEHNSGQALSMAFCTLPGLSFAGGGFLAYRRSVPLLASDIQFSTTVLNIGPYQEYSFKTLVGRKFGKAVYAFLQPEFRQLAIRAYGRRGDLAFAAALAYRQRNWLFTFYIQQQLSDENRSPFLQMAWNYAFSERLRLGLSLKKLPFFSWQTLASMEYAPDKKQSFHLALTRGPGCLVGYERERGSVKMRFGLAYSAYGGLYPENAFQFNW